MVMTDWLALARLTHPQLPDEQVARYAQILEALEEVFQPTTKALTMCDEPASVFEPEVRQ